MARGSSLCHDLTVGSVVPARCSSSVGDSKLAHQLSWRESPSVARSAEPWKSQSCVDGGGGDDDDDDDDNDDDDDDDDDERVVDHRRPYTPLGEDRGRRDRRRYIVKHV